MKLFAYTDVVLNFSAHTPVKLKILTLHYLFPGFQRGCDGGLRQTVWLWSHLSLRGFGQLELCSGVCNLRHWGETIKANTTDGQDLKHIADADVLRLYIYIYIYLLGWCQTAFWENPPLCSWLWKQSGVWNIVYICLPHRGPWWVLVHTDWMSHVALDVF